MRIVMKILEKWWQLTQFLLQISVIAVGIGEIATRSVAIGSWWAFIFCWIIGSSVVFVATIILAFFSLLITEGLSDKDKAEEEEKEEEEDNAEEKEFIILNKYDSGVFTLLFLLCYTAFYFLIKYGMF